MIIRGNTVGTPISVEKIAEKIGDTGGGIAPLLVSLDDNIMEMAGKASHTSGEIFNQCGLGGQVFIYMSNTYIPVSYVYAERADFIITDSILDKAGQTIVTIDADGNYTISVVRYATSDQIGDISSALDELHTYAQGLITGGAAE